MGPARKAVTITALVLIPLLLATPAFPTALAGPGDTSGAEPASTPGAGEDGTASAHPEGPARVTATAGSAVVHLTWQGPAPSTGTVLGYSVYRWAVGPPEGGTAETEAGGGGAVPPGDPVLVATLLYDTTSYLDYGVVNGETYVYAVTARYDAKVESPPTPAAPVTPAARALRVVLFVGEARALVNGEEVTLDVPAQILSDRAMVPLRFAGTSLGADIDYDPGPRQVTATLGRRVVRLWVDEPEAEIDGLPRPIEAPPVIRGGRTLVPVRFLSEAFGAVVEYDDVTRRVSVTLVDEDAWPYAASVLAPGVTHRAALSGSNDVDYYCFPAAPGRVYLIRTHNLAAGCDTVLGVLDQSWAVAQVNDDCCPASRASAVEVRVPAGSQAGGTDSGTGGTGTGGAACLYFKVQSANPGGASSSGSYSVTVTDLGEEPAALAVRLTPGGKPVEGLLEGPLQRDYYVFQAVAGELYAIRTGEAAPAGADGRPLETAAALELLDYFLTPLARETGLSSPGPGLAEIRWECPESGDYYVRVSAPTGRPGSYSLWVGPAEPEGHDSPTTALAVRPDHDSPLRWLSSPADQDWYTFEAVAGTTYYLQTVDLGPGTDTVIALFGGPGGWVELARNDDARGCGSLVVWKALETGTLYARVTSYAAPEDPYAAPEDGSLGGTPRAAGSSLGSYRFCVTTTAPETDNHPRDAARIHPDGLPLLRSLVEADRDFFTFEAVPGVTYVLRTAALVPGLDTYLVLFDEGWSVLAENDDEGEGLYGSFVRWTAPARGRVYVCVFPVPSDGQRGTGIYTLSLTTVLGGSGR